MHIVTLTLNNMITMCRCDVHLNELILLFLHLEVPHTHPLDDSSCPKASARTQ